MKLRKGEKKNNGQYIKTVRSKRKNNNADRNGERKKGRGMEMKKKMWK